MHLFAFVKIFPIYVDSWKTAKHALNVYTAYFDCKYNSTNSTPSLTGEAFAGEENRLSE